ncbi:MAG TPA: cytochrome c oxidase assembly protein [Streptosporangiaceae bacterium]|nr:cytochrome c oxidase assembly protein [Streptosporangiaceae bacterium]
MPTIGAGVAALGYLSARRRLLRQPRRPAAPRAGSRLRLACFGAGLLAIVVAVDGPPDVLSDVSFSAHMVQHMLLQLVAPPLLLLGGPLSLLLRADPPWLPRRVLSRVLRSRPVRIAAHPVTALGLFTVVLAGSHLSPLFSLTLARPWVHELEHVAFLVTALLLWWPAIGIDPAPRRLGYPARLLYLLLDMPVMAYLGLAIANASRVLYPYYAAHPPPWGASALADQGVAGTIMWISGTFTMVPAMAVLLLRWLDEDARKQARLDARHRSPAAPAGGRLRPEAVAPPCAGPAAS